MTSLTPTFGSCFDRLSLGGDLPWKINPRTQYMETQVPMTWVGVRQYGRTPYGPQAAMVLHRPEQTGSESFARTLRGVPATDDHPSVDGVPVDVLAGPLSARFKVGGAGDLVTLVEMPVMHRGRRLGMAEVPTCRVTIDKLEVIRKIEEGQRQTSLGYRPLWLPPPPDELRGETENGLPIGVWESPWGEIEYNYEHVLDVTCKRALDYFAKADEDPETFGANHIAVALLRGRGEQASEMFRAVDAPDGTRDSLYFDMAVRAADTQETPMTPEKIVMFSVGDSLPTTIRAALQKRGINFPHITIDMPEEYMGKMKEMRSMMMEMATTIGEMMGEGEKMEEDRDAMMKERDEMKEKEGEMEEKAKTAMDSLTKAEARLSELEALHLGQVARDAVALLGEEKAKEHSKELLELKTEGDIHRAVVGILRPGLALDGCSDDMARGMFAMLEAPANANDSVPASRSPFAGVIPDGPRSPGVTDSDKKSDLDRSLAAIG